MILIYTITFIISPFCIFSNTENQKPNLKIYQLQKAQDSKCFKTSSALEFMD